MNTSTMSLAIRRVSPTLSRFVGRRALLAKKNSPHIFFVAGLVGSVTSTVLACRATLKLSETLDHIQEDVAVTKQTYPTPGDANRELAHAYLRGGIELAKLYGPSVGIAVVSYSLLSGSHVQLTRRNTALMAAYAVVQKAYDDYRERVIAELGADREEHLYKGLTEVVNTDSGEVVGVVDPFGMSPYAKFFDETSTAFEKHPDYNRAFISCQQTYANDRLRARGHMFLNEVYDMLGFEHTTPGSVVGWLWNGDGDNYIDFGLYKAINSEFANGLEPRILLDFNVDGVIYDKI